MSVIQAESTEIQLTAPTGGLWSDAWSRLRKNPGAIVGAFIVASFVVIAIFAPLLAPYSPKEIHLDWLGTSCCPGPSSQHWLGIDQVGRDEFSRILYGARYSLVIGIVAVAAGLTIGLLFGSIAGYFGGFADSVIMRSRGSCSRSASWPRSAPVSGRS
jgi:peptide/nickel transport system permease protein